MNLALSAEQELLRDTFERLFAAESSPERVRQAEPLGFDASLWKTLAETDAIGHPRTRVGGRERQPACSMRCWSRSRPGATWPRARSSSPSSPRRSWPAPTSLLARDALRARARRQRGRHDRAAQRAERRVAAGARGRRRRRRRRPRRRRAGPRDPGRGADAPRSPISERAPFARWSLSSVPRGGERVVLASGSEARRRASGSRSTNGVCSLPRRSTGWRAVRSTSPPRTRPNGCSSTGPSARSRASRIHWPTRSPTSRERGCWCGSRSGRSRSRAPDAASLVPFALGWAIAHGDARRARAPCTPTAATASRSNTTSSSTTGAPRRGR